MFEFWIKFYWNSRECFIDDKSDRIGSDSGLVPNRLQVTTVNYDGKA